MPDWAHEVEAVRPADFSGVVSIGSPDRVEWEGAFGVADRARRTPVTPATRFAIASGTKGFTALIVADLLASRELALTTPARSVLGDELPLGDGVTVERLLNHTSGIADYIDHETGQLLADVSGHQLANTEDYVAVFRELPEEFPPGARFGYCNSNYIVLARIAERLSGRSFQDLVADRVFSPAGMASSGFFRTDDLPADAAVGYLDDGRTNAHVVPVRGSGDGGAYTTVEDVRRFWAALTAGRIVAPEWVQRMTSPQSAGPPEYRMSYGWGFWLDGPIVVLDGGDHGVSFRSAFDPSSGRLWTVVANTSGGIGPILGRVRPLLF